MAVPEFNEIKAPALEFFADGRPHPTSEIFSVLAERFKLTEADQNELLPSGAQPRWHNRANWACYDLYRAGLLERPKKGVYVISELGKKVVAEKPAKIDREYLMRFPQFAKWITKTGENSASNLQKAASEDLINQKATPHEVIENAHEKLYAQLRSELLDLVHKVKPFRFERVVLDLLLAMGYGGSRSEAAVAGKGVNDGGIDGLINEDRLGLDRIYVQAKRWQETVGRPQIQNFVGALAGQHATKGIFITTSDFSENATAFAKSVPQRLILIDGQRLAELMIEYNIGVSRAFSYEIKRVDSDYFEEE
jgi:restriction system protein